MRVEQEQKVTEDARRFAEQEAEAQRYAAQVLQVPFSSHIFIFNFCIWLRSLFLQEMMLAVLHIPIRFWMGHFTILS